MIDVTVAIGAARETLHNLFPQAYSIRLEGVEPPSDVDHTPEWTITLSFRDKSDPLAGLAEAIAETRGVDGRTRHYRTFFIHAENGRWLKMTPSSPPQ